MRFRYGLAGIVFLIALAPVVAASPQWIVVTAPAFRKAVQPLLDHRREQGFRVVTLQTTDVLSTEEVRTGAAAKLRERINTLCREHAGPSFVLLVGAVETESATDASNRVLPALSGTIGRMKGQLSDNGYGCLDDSRLPAVAIGRFPARIEAEARGMVAKTLEYERDARPGLWRRRLTILAGIPAYNPLVDRMVESLALARFGRLSPEWFGHAIYSNPQSRFSLPDEVLRTRAQRYVEEGEAFTLYLGHSSPEGLYGGRARYLDRDDWSRMQIGRGKGVFLTFGCNGCQLKGTDGEGYGVAAIRNPNGPVACIGSHGICFASMVQLAADGLFESTFARRPPERLGEAWLALKKGLAHGKIDDFTYGLLDAVDGDKRISQATQRQEHLEMFVLLGDPALRLPIMRDDLDISTEAAVLPGSSLTVRGTVPERLRGARVRLSLERTVNSVPGDLEGVPKPADSSDAQRNRVILANHERANRFVVATAECTAADHRFAARIAVPAKSAGPRLILRVYAATEREEGMAVRTLAIKKSATPTPNGGP